MRMRARKRLRKVIITGEHICGMVLMVSVVYAAIGMKLYSERKKEKLNNYYGRTV